MNALVLAITLPATGLAWWDFSRPRLRQSASGALVRSIAVGVVSFILLKNVADILWLGHEALLR